MRSRCAAAVGVTVAMLVAVAPSALAADLGHGVAPQNRPSRVSVAVIGDVPYGDAQIAAFPTWIKEINAADPAMTFHVGDIKNGSTRCDDTYYAWFKKQVDGFVNPFVLTPGDNEWTDCHRANNGAYQPLDRLAVERRILFPRPGVTLGRTPMQVVSAADGGFPEITGFRSQQIDVAMLHIVGSNDDLQPWTGLGERDVTAAQVAEEKSRMAANIAAMRTAFESARTHHDRAVVLMQQADMFDPTYPPKATDISAFTPFVHALVEESNAFGGPVYLINGDSHVYNADTPLAKDSSWLATYGVRGAADNLQRITVDGSSHHQDWLKVTLNEPGSRDVLSWTRVPLSAPGDVTRWGVEVPPMLRLLRRPGPPAATTAQARCPATGRAAQ